MRTPPPQETRQVLNYTIMALVGMLAGFVLGGLYSGSHPAGVQHETTPPVPHPRTIEPTR
jgi:hypothetical protein